MCILNVIYSLSCWTHHLIIYHFQAYSLIAGHFVGPSEPALWLYFVHFSLCLVSAPKLWTYINSCIKTIQLYYEVDFVINAALNSDWVRISLCVRLVRIGMEPWRGTLPMCRSWIRDSGRDMYFIESFSKSRGSNCAREMDICIT